MPFAIMCILSILSLKFVLKKNAYIINNNDQRCAINSVILLLIGSTGLDGLGDIVCLQQGHSAIVSRYYLDLYAHKISQIGSKINNWECILLFVVALNHTL